MKLADALQVHIPQPPILVLFQNRSESAAPRGAQLEIFRPRTVPILSTVNLSLLPACLIFNFPCF